MRAALLLVVSACGSAAGAAGAADAGAEPPDATFFDDCGDDEIAIAGGGCRRVGPPADCWPGWRPAGDGGCEPVLPASPCPDGTMERIGENECVPIGDCGDGKGTWGAIETGVATVFVDVSYEGADADGSEARPFPRVQDAVDAALASGFSDPQVVVAAGEYVEDVLVTAALRLDGRCAGMVTIRGVTEKIPAVWIYWPDGEVRVRGFTVTGPGYGVAGYGSGRVVVEDVAVVDCGSVGGGWELFGEIAVRRSLFARDACVGFGIYGAAATLEDVVLRDTRPCEDGRYGDGIEALAHDENPEPSALALLRVLLDGNTETGMFAWGSTVEAEELVVTGTRAQALDGRYGGGVDVEGDVARDLAGGISLRRSLLRGNHDVGLYAIAASATIEDVTVRETMAQESDGRYGVGLEIGDDEDSGVPSDAAIRRCLVADSATAGVGIYHSTATVEDTIVRDTRAEEAGGEYGDGVGVYRVGGEPTTGGLSGLRVLRAARAGVAFYDAAGSLRASRLSENLLAVALDAGADPAIGDDLLMKGNGRDEIVVGQGLDPPPPVEPGGR